MRVVNNLIIMLSQAALQAILGIKEKVSLSPSEMVEEMKVAFFPVEGSDVDEHVRAFASRLKNSLTALGVEIVDYNSCLGKVSWNKRLNRLSKIILNNIRYLFAKLFRISGDFYYLNFHAIKKTFKGTRLKKGVAVIVLGTLHHHELPMQFISSFKSNSIIHLVKFPKNIHSATGFEEHFDTAMSLFAYHMANIVIGIDQEKWMIYNFNASHPIYHLNDGKFEEHLLHALIPKIVAPISPHRFHEFKIASERFKPDHDPVKNLIVDLQAGAKLLDKTNLFPKGKKIEDLPFRDNFHKLIGKLHLDNRSGMSFGFIAKQLPIEPVQLLSSEDTRKQYANYIDESKDYFLDENRNIHIFLDLPNNARYSMPIPDVWVLTLRSGSNKTNFNPNKDTLLLGLTSKGEMTMKFPEHVKISEDYKPSFDTKVILAHAMGNIIIASILNHIKQNTQFVEQMKTDGMSLSHWHGYFNESLIPDDLVMYGFANLHVACSSPQSALYALGGKLTAFQDRLNNNGNHNGDIHIEPHHGINISYPSLAKLAEYLVMNPEASKLGNIYLKE